jgi:DNA-directed RNA polymerase specialized sigma24 family protein
VVERHTPSVYGLCRALVGRRAAALELAQEAFLQGLRELHSLPRPMRFAPWLLGIARNLCRGWRGNRVGRGFAPSDTGPDRPLFVLPSIA